MKTIKIFFSCAHHSHEDEKYISYLEKHLAQVQRESKVDIWHVHLASPGADLQHDSLTHLKNADIILLFVSPDYISSDHCVNLEGKGAVLQERQGTATVRVVLLHSADWNNTPFRNCQILPKNGRFISTLSSKNLRDQALLDIVGDIRIIIQEIQKKRSEQTVKRAEYNNVPDQTHVMTTMPPIESLMLNRQTDDIKLHRQTDDVKPKRQANAIKTARQTNNIQGIKQTENLKDKRTYRKAKPNGKTLADEAVMPTRKKALPRSKGRGRSGEILTRKLRSTDIANWLYRAGKEYRFMNKGYRRLFFYPTIIIDAIGIPAAIFIWSNSWLLFWLALFFALGGVVIGALNTDILIPIPLALLYAVVWGIVIDHYFSHPLYVFGIGGVIALVHVLIFNKNHR